jgi:hypothetical protein
METRSRNACGDDGVLAAAQELKVTLARFTATMLPNQP